MNCYRYTLAFSLIAVISLACAGDEDTAPRLSLTLIPPSPVTDQIELDIRGAIRNDGLTDEKYQVRVLLDTGGTVTSLYECDLVVSASSANGFGFRWSTEGHFGRHKVVLRVDGVGESFSTSQPLEILASTIRSTRRIDGAWAGIYHWSEKEGARWNDEIRQMTDEQWRGIVRGMHEIGWDTIVIQEVFRNQVYEGKHHIEQDGYQGKAFYPSRLYPGRMDTAAKDPVEAILCEADALGMNVFLGLGLYAWFDFSPGSLEWHKRVATELWEMYGHHRSVYGWYVSEEVPGSMVLDNHSDEDTIRYKREIVTFFRELRSHCRTFAPDKPIMLASNSYYLRKAEDAWREALRYCDILCPFGFHRMRNDDMTGEEAACLLQELCNETGAHLWMDLEVFLFGPNGELYPRPIEGLIEDLHRFPNFEKILCYQYPGLLNAPWASLKPGGEDTVKLFLDYKEHLQKQVENRNR
ncbi:MAG TPA: DUF4434 domain-containing protein [bacterium]|nr:DUF4434 domain-containing protein [bacterium]